MPRGDETPGPEGEPEPEETAEQPPDEGAPLILPIEDALDLHTFAPRDIPGVVGDYLDECLRRGLREVRLIHGRGTGSQRAVVRRVLAGHPAVERFTDAPPERGGWGATLVHLRGAAPPD